MEQIKLEKILTAANTAPSAGDLQAYEIVVVRHAAVRSCLAVAAHGQAFLAKAPVVLVFLAEWAARYVTRGERRFCIQDATLAACHAQLAAAALGLGSCGLVRSTKAVSSKPWLRRPACSPYACWPSAMRQNGQRTHRAGISAT